MDVNTILQLIIPGFATGFGAIPVFFLKEVSQRIMDTMLGGAAGVMLSATFFSLLLPSIEAGGGGFNAALVTSLGLFVGAVVVQLTDTFAPHEHLVTHKREGGASENLKKIWLFVIAITIHNFPEGLATGVSAVPGAGGGLSLAVAIALQNMPEGLSVALALKTEDYSVGKSFFIALMTGMVEPIGAFMGYFAANLSQAILPFILAFAGGAMLFVISDEIIPQTHSNGNEREATFGLIIGFILMMLLDNLL